MKRQDKCLFVTQSGHFQTLWVSIYLLIYTFIPSVHDRNNPNPSVTERTDFYALKHLLHIEVFSLKEGICLLLLFCLEQHLKDECTDIFMTTQDNLLLKCLRLIWHRHGNDFTASKFKLRWPCLHRLLAEVSLFSVFRKATTKCLAEKGAHSRWWEAEGGGGRQGTKDETRAVCANHLQTASTAAEGSIILLTRSAALLRRHLAEKRLCLLKSNLSVWVPCLWCSGQCAEQN